jgi:hypothetical protein
MKTAIYILAALLMMNFTSLSAGNPKITILKATAKTEIISITNAELAPVTPKEATFSDNDLEPKPLPVIDRLAPITPQEATFEEIKPEPDLLSIDPLILQKIIPVTPKEAEFEESPVEMTSGIDSLAPVSPAIATFED